MKQHVLCSLVALLAAAPFHPANATPAIESVSNCADTVKRGTSTSMRVYLTEPAPAGGLTANLSTSTVNFFPPSTIFLSENQESNAVGVATKTSTSATGTLTATYNAGSASATLSSLAVHSFTFCVDPHKGQGGQGNRRFTGYIKLDTPAPVGGALVTISSTDPTFASVPASLTIPAGLDAATFNVTTASVDVESTATITVQTPSGTAAYDVTMKLPHIKEVLTNFASCTAGGTLTGTINLLADASPSGTVVSLSASSGNVSVPSTVTVPGNLRTTTFTVQCVSAGPATIFADLQGRTKSRNVTVN